MTIFDTIATDDMMQELANRHDTAILILKNQKTDGLRFLIKTSNDSIEVDPVIALRMLTEIQANILGDTRHEND